MSTVECKKCNGRGFFETPMKPASYTQFMMGDVASRREKCDECGGTGRIELRCMAWENSDEKEKLECRVAELTHEISILQQGIKKRIPHLELINLMERYGITECTIAPQGLAELKALWSNGTEILDISKISNEKIRSVNFHVK